MGVSEVSLLVIAAAMVTTGIASIVFLRRALPLMRESDRLMRRTRRTLRRMNRLMRELEFMTRDAHALEGRVTRSAHGVLDSVEPLLVALRGLIAGTRTGLGSLLNHNGNEPDRRPRHRFAEERSRT